ncbi:hypothetical protein [Rhodobacter capsulatus]|uniref:hypothetical protein n=1 Tax=Rhodobacter capsulatus TaxID=1061 RepID=UPI004024F096
MTFDDQAASDAISALLDGKYGDKTTTLGEILAAIKLRELGVRMRMILKHQPGQGVIEKYEFYHTVNGSEKQFRLTNGRYTGGKKNVDIELWYECCKIVRKNITPGGKNEGLVDLNAALSKNDLARWRELSETANAFLKQIGLERINAIGMHFLSETRLPQTLELELLRLNISYVFDGYLSCGAFCRKSGSVVAFTMKGDPLSSAYNAPDALRWRQQPLGYTISDDNIALAHDLLALVPLFKLGL